MPRPKKPSILPSVFAESEVEVLLNNTTNAKHKCMLMLSYGCGLRVSEIAGLQLQHIDSKRMMLLVKRAKGKKDRMVPLPTILLPTLKDYYKEYKPKQLSAYE